MAYSAVESVVIVRSSYTDSESNMVTQLLAIDSHDHHVINTLGNAMVAVCSSSAQFVTGTGVLVVAYSSLAELTADKG